MSKDAQKRYCRQEQKRIESAREALRYVSGALRFMGVRTVRVTFDYLHDWLDISGLVCEPVSPEEWPDGLEGTIKTAFRELLPDETEIVEYGVRTRTFDGGRITLDAETGEVKVDYQE